ncbi:MAG: amidohydrolase [Clostridia bacterium]|nr:amidohydrolase [Clostridia bacterium]
MSSILIKNAYIVSMVSPISKADLYIEDGLIKEIGIIDKEADKTIDASGKVVMPGLINTHTHVAMSVFRGYSDELELMEWLSTKMWPIEDKMVSDDVYYASLLSIVEMIKSGTTTFNDQYFFEEATAKAASEMGMRAMLSRCIIGDNEGADTRIKEAEELYNVWNNASNGKINICVGIHAPYTCSPETIVKSIELAKKLNTMIHIHYLETEDEIKQIKEKYNKTVTEYLKETGIFDCKTLLAHGVWINETDVEELKKYDVAVSHNPISNQKLGSGIANIKMLLEKGITVAIGTDGQGSTNTLDMFEEIKSALYLQKVVNKSATAMSGYEALKMATIDGAKALGLEKEIGSLEVGKKADVIIIDLDKPHLIPVHDIYSTLAYSVNGADVETVIIDGNIVMEDRKMLTIDEKMVKKEINKVVNRLFKD